MCLGGGPAGGPGGIRMPNRGGIPGGGRGGIRSPGIPGMPGRSGGGRIISAGCIGAGPGMGIDGIGTYLTVGSEGCGAGFGSAMVGFGGIGIALTEVSG